MAFYFSRTLIVALAIGQLLHATPISVPDQRNEEDFPAVHDPYSYISHERQVPRNAYQTSEDTSDKRVRNAVINDEEYTWNTVEKASPELLKRSDSAYDGGDSTSYEDVAVEEITEGIELLGRTVHRKKPTLTKRTGDTVPTASAVPDYSQQVYLASDEEWGPTWWDFIPIPRDRINLTMMKRIAKTAYDSITNGEENTVVSVLYVPNAGCFIGSTPHGRGITTFEERAQARATVLWHHIGNRETVVRAADSIKKGDTTLWHAEDMVCYMYEKFMRQHREPVPGPKYWYKDVDSAESRPRVIAYGKSWAGATPDFMRACDHTTTGGVKPGCRQVMVRLGVNAVDAK